MNFILALILFVASCCPDRVNPYVVPKLGTPVQGHVTKYQNFPKTLSFYKIYRFCFYSDLGNSPAQNPEVNVDFIYPGRSAVDKRFPDLGNGNFQYDLWDDHGIFYKHTECLPYLRPYDLWISGFPKPVGKWTVTITGYNYKDQGKSPILFSHRQNFTVK